MTKEHVVLRRKSPGKKTWDVSPTYTNATCLGTLLFTAQVAESAKLLRGQLPSPRTLARCPESPVPSPTPQSSPSTGSLPAHRLKESAFPGGSAGKESASCSGGDPGSIPGSGRSPGEGNSNLLCYSCLESVALSSSSRGSSRPRDRTCVSYTAGGLFTIGTPGKPILYWGIASE